jgi:K+-sensing histidine kinase KdpD
MATEISLSYQRVDAQFTSTQVNASRQNLALAYQGKNPSNLLSAQQQQIVDEVGISDAAIKQFEEAQKLAQQLQAYTDYLYGRSDDKNLVRLTEPDGEATAVVVGRSTELSASITTASVREETLDVNARFDNDGDLEELSISKTETNIEYERIEVSLRDTQFFGAYTV